MIHITTLPSAMSSLSPAALKIFLFLREKANRNTNSSFWRKSKIAVACHMSLSTFSRALRELKEKHLVVVKERYETCGRQKSNEYFVASIDAEKSTRVQEDARQLSGSAYKVYLFLSQKCGNAALYAVSKREIALACHLSYSTVKTALRHLKSKNYITRVACTKEDNSQGFNRYKLANLKRRLHNLKLILLSLLKNIDTLPGLSVTPLGTLSKLRLKVRKREREILNFTIWEKSSKLNKWDGAYLLIDRAKAFMRLLC